MRFGPWKIPKCLENGPFGDQKWVKNGSKTCFSKIDLGPFGMPKQKFLAHSAPAVTRFGPWKIPKCLENGPFWDENESKMGENHVFPIVILDHLGCTNKCNKPMLSSGSLLEKHGKAQDCGSRLLAGGKPRLQAVRWPRLLEYLSGGLDRQPVLAPTSTWDQAKRSLLSSATTCALASSFLRRHEACNDVWQDLWSQRYEGGRVPSRSILPLVCNGCGTMAPVWVHQCASTPLCGSCRERTGKGWPNSRWVMRHSGQLLSSAWKAIQRDLRDAQVDGVRCLDDPIAVLPLLLWWAALDGDSRVVWLWYNRGVL